MFKDFSRNWLQHYFYFRNWQFSITFCLHSFWYALEIGYCCENVLIRCESEYEHIAALNKVASLHAVCSMDLKLSIYKAQISLFHNNQ